MEEVRYWEVVKQEFDCQHDDTNLVRYIKSNGVVCVRIQCKVCGTSIKEVPKKGLDAETLPMFDESLRHDWDERKSQRRNELFEKYREKNNQQHEQYKQEQDERHQVYLQEVAERNRQWWIDYNTYLRSERWHTIRQRVLERDNHICQACLKNKAAQVHHLSYVLYNEVGRSAAFELVAICFTCHKEIHPDRAMAQHDLTANAYNPFIGAIPQWMPEDD